MANTKKIALITGANKGIGKETARQLGQQGYTVLVGARDLAKGQAAADELKAAGIDAHAVEIDVTSGASIAKAVGWVTERFSHLDALINNAGVALDFGRTSSEAPEDIWRQTFDTNVFGLVSTTQAFLPLVRKSPAGRIVHLTSILGSIALVSDPKSPIGGVSGTGAAYGASKAAVNMFTAHLARELAGTAIKVNAAHPGWVKTELGGEGAMLEIPEGARTSVALATLGADGPTGQYIHQGQQLPW
ncbi:MAG: SDR family oxidoreductase [Myxococcales bacterium]|nr:MAG: SDR family oxidoreductase [Myxococcales bacterium]